jgi:membrane fusion protein
LGSILLVAPVSFAVLTAVAVVLSGALVLLLAFGSYTERSTVTGQLVSDAGLARIYSPQPGIVLGQHVSEGQAVKAGAVLFIVSTERYSETLSATQSLISQSVRERAQSLRAEMSNTQALQAQQRRAGLRKAEGERTELDKIAAQIKSQKQRVQIAEDSAARYQKLSDRGMAAADLLQQKNGEVLDQHAKLQELERDQIYHERELAAVKAELIDLDLLQKNEMSKLERDLAGISQELAESEAKRQVAITSPENGIATAVAAREGQSVDTSKPMVTLLPERATLHAELYAPSRSVGFIRPGDQVVLRYEAFPYQKFGNQKGVVASVSRTALPAQELSGMLTLGGASGGEPLYLVTVSLVAQTVTAYGLPQALQPGMLLEADILREKRHLYEWVLEPIYSLTGRI